MPRRTRQHVDPALRKALAKNLRDARTAANLTQRELGRLAGVSYDYIGQIEAAEANVSIDVLSMLARSLGKTIAALLTL